MADGKSLALDENQQRKLVRKRLQDICIAINSGDLERARSLLTDNFNRAQEGDRVSFYVFLGFFDQGPIEGLSPKQRIAAIGNEFLKVLLKNFMVDFPVISMISGSEEGKNKLQFAVYLLNSFSREIPEVLADAGLEAFQELSWPSRKAIITVAGNHSQDFESFLKRLEADNLDPRDRQDIVQGIPSIAKIFHASDFFPARYTPTFGANSIYDAALELRKLPISKGAALVMFNFSLSPVYLELITKLLSEDKRIVKQIRSFGKDRVVDAIATVIEAGRLLGVKGKQDEAVSLIADAAKKNDAVPFFGQGLIKYAKSLELAHSVGGLQFALNTQQQRRVATRDVF
ncbi:MAG TPA: hypothetical protein VI912_00480 [Candidatus Bilamarchaeaceae archaeon]|nr:hypothetical protein [Candidatus Bilamarchaeaceae archaeon]